MQPLLFRLGQGPFGGRGPGRGPLVLPAQPAVRRRRLVGLTRRGGAAGARSPAAADGTGMSTQLDQSMRWRDPVRPMAGGVPRPRWSVMIPTYRCAHLLRATLESVLAQDPGPQAMQIEVVDDASDDDPEAVVKAVAGDRVAFLRHPRNLGHVANFHACLVRSRGEIVHLLHGDDLVRPGFYTALGRGFEIFPELGAAFCRSVYIDADGAEMGLVPAEQAQAGLLQDALARLASEQRIM